VPQSRKRVFFVGFRSDLRAAREDGVFAWPEEPSDCGGTVDDVLEDERGEAAARCEVSEYQMDRAAAFFRRQQGRTGDVDPGASNTHAGYLFPTDGVARTLCASYRKSSVYNAELVPPVGNDGGDDGGSVRTRPRYYTVRECARLQGFPETFYPDPERGYHELGNSVCVPLVRAIGEEVLRALEAS
jgi:DNA (cytosine-5)-methyltransferase 1